MLTEQEKQWVIEVLAKVGLDLQGSEMRRSVIQKLQLPPTTAKEEKVEK